MNRWLVWMLLCCLGTTDGIVDDHQHDHDNEAARLALRWVEFVRNNACSGGTALDLRVEIDHTPWEVYANEAVTMANYLSAILSSDSNSLISLSDELFFDLVISNVQNFDSPIFGSAIALEDYVYPPYMKFSPYAYRKDKVYSHDISINYDYSSPSTEWYAELRSRSWGDIVNTTTTEIRYRVGNTAAPAITRQTPVARLADGHWTYPYFDCGGGDIWMFTYSAPILGLENGNPVFKGVGTIDIQLTDVDINQCDADDVMASGVSLPVFRGSHHCQPTTRCLHVEGEGFVRGSYKCVCEEGYYFPDTEAEMRYYSGQVIEAYFDDNEATEQNFQCRKCADGCRACVDDSPCLYEQNEYLEAGFLVGSAFTLICVIIVSIVVIIFRQNEAVKLASPTFLTIMNIGAALMCIRMLLEYLDKKDILCMVRIWPHHIGFILLYGVLLIKSWRIAGIFKKLRLNDHSVMNRFVPLVAITAVYLALWTAIGQPEVEWEEENDDLRFERCTVGWWDYGAVLGEKSVVLWGLYLMIILRRKSSIAGENVRIIWCLINVIVLGTVIFALRETVALDHGPDALLIANFAYLQVAVTITFCIYYLPLLYALYKSSPDHQAYKAEESKPYEENAGNTRDSMAEVPNGTGSATDLDGGLI